MRMRSYRGNTLTEYGFIGVLILVASIGVIYALGGGLNTSLAALKADLTGNIKSAGNAQYGVLPQNLWDSASTLPPMQSGQQQVCFDTGMCVTIPVTSAGKSSTSGGLGSQETQALSLVLQQIAQKLQESGADPDLVAKITKLANEGHDLSSYLRQTADEYKNTTGYLATGQYDPQTDFMTGMGYSINMGNNKSLMTTGTAEFSQAWQDVQVAFAQNPNDPAMQTAKAIIDAQAQQIMDISTSVPLDIPFEEIVANPTMPIAAEITRQDANTICQTGGNMGQCYVNTGSGWQTP